MRSRRSRVRREEERVHERRLIVEFSKWVYRVLLIAYPREFRDRYGAELEQTFGNLCREKVELSDSAGLARLWVRTLLDLAHTAAAQRVSAHSRVEEKEATMNERRLAGIGLFFLVAPALFVLASLLKYELGVGFLFRPFEVLMSEPGSRHLFNLVSPVVFLGGLVLALALNAYAVLRLDVGREDGAIVGTLRFEPRFLNVAVGAASLLLMVTLAGYLFVENIVYRS
jgi:hypothetical protein